MSVKTFDSAKNCLKWAKLMINSDDEFDLKQSAYNIQQCVEKTLKFLLNDVGVTPKKTHDISVLLSQLPENYDSIDEEVVLKVYSFAPSLTEWEAKTRYDEDYLVARRFVLYGLELASELVGVVDTYIETHTGKSNSDSMHLMCFDV